MYVCPQRELFHLLALKAQDGGWSEWAEWSDCSKGCDGGKRNRFRFCNKPAPAYGGKECPGERKEEEDCNEEKCPGKLEIDHSVIMILLLSLFTIFIFVLLNLYLSITQW